MYDIPHRISVLMGLKLRVSLFPEKLYLVIKTAVTYVKWDCPLNVQWSYVYQNSETALILVRL